MSESRLLTVETLLWAIVVTLLLMLFGEIALIASSTRLKDALTERPAVTVVRLRGARPGDVLVWPNDGSPTWRSDADREGRP